MENLIKELQALAEKVAGGPVHVDVTWVVSAKAGTTITASSSSQEAALAAFVAGVLEERADTKLATADRQDARQGRLVEPPMVAAPAQPGVDRVAMGRANRERINALHQAGKTATQIIAETGLASSVVYTHLKQLREKEAAGANGDGFRAAN